jgi:phosphoribosylanthranilate isomerase
VSLSKLKVCGVLTPQEMYDLFNISLDYIGLNFIKTSKRCVTYDSAKKILDVKNARQSIKAVALFKDQAVDSVIHIIESLNFDLVQLNGSEDQAYINLMPVPVLRTIYVSESDTAETVLDRIDAIKANYYILDRQIQGQGSMVSTSLTNKVIEENQDKIFLAGGISPENIAGVLNETHPYGIDIAGGLRSGEAIDAQKVIACLDVIKSIQGI